jgi:hypothetical protein
MALARYSQLLESSIRSGGRSSPKRQRCSHQIHHWPPATAFTGKVCGVSPAANGAGRPSALQRSTCDTAAVEAGAPPVLLALARATGVVLRCARGSPRNHRQRGGGSCFLHSDFCPEDWRAAVSYTLSHSRATEIENTEVAWLGRGAAHGRLHIMSLTDRKVINSHR